MSKLTDWFPADVKPVRVGQYEVANTHYGDPFPLHWDGRKWCLSDTKTPAIFQNREWRGLAADPEQQP